MVTWNAQQPRTMQSHSHQGRARTHIPANKHVPGRTNTLFGEGLDKACNLVLFKVREIPVGHGVSVGLVRACDLQPLLALALSPVTHVDKIRIVAHAQRDTAKARTCREQVRRCW
jgi:hypothetical protein